MKLLFNFDCDFVEETLYLTSMANRKPIFACSWFLLIISWWSYGKLFMDSEYESKFSIKVVCSLEVLCSKSLEHMTFDH